ncbi:ly6/PLAUR domain-containing protein 6B isoform X2 [Oenanthe melanoleuca]|uniref:ly6/PLAUR domain-containing protein 6B isoform X2 n=1 Tax=Oenanthe melanoleuca TaxID=2939378 RepID=UPI0024C1DE7E|nr:ly6/PLAUR domain-containing protein 6B isoform X2 [Oenanthe melanoleuca]
MGLLRRALAAAVLPLLVLPGIWVSAENINFHNIRPPLDPTPFPNSFKCFTCDNAVDNYNCNRWAEDRWCPATRGESTSVTKKCATGEECHLVGCHRLGDGGHTECVSCCEGMICNVEIPTNATNAVLAVLQARRAGGGRALPSLALPSLALLVAAVTVALS